MGSASSRTPDSGMTVTPAADAAYIVPTLERFCSKLLDLTTRDILLNLSIKSQQATRLLRFADCNLRVVIAWRQYSLSALPRPPKGKQIVHEGEIEAVLAKERNEGLLDWIPLHIQAETGLDETWV